MFEKKKKDSRSDRRHKRLRADYLMTYQPVGSEGEPLAANIKDISATGIRFLSEQFFAEGTDMNIAVAIPPLGRNLQAVARVMRMRMAAKNTSLYYVCMHFVEIDEKIQEDLDAFIEKLASIQQAKFMVDDKGRRNRRGEF